MGNGPWSNPCVGSHVFLLEPAPETGGSWDTIPSEWQSIRFDAVDVLFLSPFRVNIAGHSFALALPDGETLEARFSWVIQAARSANPNVKIVTMQFMGGNASGTQTDFSGDWTAEDTAEYAASVASFLELWYNKELPSLGGDGQVSARINGWDVDVEPGTEEPVLPSILAAVRASVDELSSKLQAPRFSVSITPYQITDLTTGNVAQSVDYINMQNYNGGQETLPQTYLQAIPGLQESQLVWGICSENPSLNTLQSFGAVQQQAQSISKGQGAGLAGMWTWRLNSTDYLFESTFQVWLYDTIHVTTLPRSEPKHVVRKGWKDNGGQA